jgi:hypothetical protein
MTTPQGNSPDEVPSPPTEHTPVIIKTGGDGVPGSTELPVEIESSMMDFIESEPGPTWVRAQSALPGRITEMSISEGKEPPLDYEIPRERLATTKELATLRIDYGSVQIRMWESILPNSKDLVVLNIESDIPFNVTKPGNWREAGATFPPITRVVFTSGNETKVDHPFTVSNPKIHVNFDRTKIVDG